MFLKSTEKHKKWLNDGIMGDFLFSIFPILYMTATFFYNEKNLAHLHPAPSPYKSVRITTYYLI